MSSAKIRPSREMYKARPSLTTGRQCWEAWLHPSNCTLNTFYGSISQTAKRKRTHRKLVRKTKFVLLRRVSIL